MKSVWWIVRPERSAAYPSAAHLLGEGGVTTGCGLTLEDKPAYRTGNAQVSCGSCLIRMEKRHLSNPIGTFNPRLRRGKGATQEEVEDALRRFKEKGGQVAKEPAYASPLRNLVGGAVSRIFCKQRGLRDGVFLMRRVSNVRLENTLKYHGHRLGIDEVESVTAELRSARKVIEIAAKVRIGHKHSNTHAKTHGPAFIAHSGTLKDAIKTHQAQFPEG